MAMTSTQSARRWCAATLVLLQLMAGCGVLGETHTVDWTVAGVTPYAGTTLNVRIGDTVNLVCAMDSYSNVVNLRDGSLEDFTNCDGDTLISIKSCTGTVRNLTLSIKIPTLGGGAQTAVDYTVNEIYYFASFAPADCTSGACSLDTEPGPNTDCQNRGIKIAIKVLPAPEPVTTPPPVSSTSASSSSTVGLPDATSTVGPPETLGLYDGATCSSSPRLSVLIGSLLLTVFLSLILRH